MTFFSRLLANFLILGAIQLGRLLLLAYCTVEETWILSVEVMSLPLADIHVNENDLQSIVYICCHRQAYIAYE